LWIGAPTINRAQLVARLPRLHLSAPVRARYQYNNLAYITAGHVIERISGHSWEDYTRTRIFAPLGMMRSAFDNRAFANDADAASAHQFTDGVVYVVPQRTPELVGPAGSVVSTARDLAPWIRLHLKRGKLGETALVDEGVYAALSRAVSVESGGGGSAVAGYALGWRTDNFRGLARQTHGGVVQGFAARLSLIPERGIGVAVLANLENSPLPEQLSRVILDRLLETQPIDWLGRAKKRWDEGWPRRKAERDRLVASLGKPERAPLPLAAYAGRFTHPGWGEIAITEQGKALALRYNGFAIPLLHWRGGIFIAQPRPEDDSYEGLRVQFRTDMDGRIASFDAVMEERVPAYSFAKAPEPQSSAALAAWAGDYAEPDGTWSIRANPAGLLITLPGQEATPLVPALENGMMIAGDLTTRLELIRDKGNTPIGLRVIRPDGIALYPKVK
jgi:hypothetical protein